MNRSIRNIFTSLLTVAICLFSMQVYAELGEKEQAYYDNYQSILQVMKKGMDSAPKTGDPSLDFLYEMIPHHEAAVSMAENILKYGSNEQVKKLATAIVHDQLKGIAQMEALLKKLKQNPQVDKAKEAAYLKVYNKAHNEMMKAMEEAKPTGNIDRDFLEEMIPHHEGAVKMASNILNYTNNEELKAIAQNIVTSQQKQLEEMKQLLQTIR
ncbi:DUF305 domain-containing protein [Bacillus massiliigorillae]|uniref:DUF305 domain-containing protein n=1 Tax=Bacillus massiliigorillae TaxID=1243664 RepID=UPI001E35D1D7|nr:DUF305 domain-containing protein [Bacillus massiliigorillae]